MQVHALTILKPKHRVNEIYICFFLLVTMQISIVKVFIFEKLIQYNNILAYGHKIVNCASHTTKF